MAEHAQISDADLIRVLGEYTAKATSAHQNYVRGLQGVSVTTALIGGGLGVMLGVTLSGTAFFTAISLILAVGITTVVVYIATEKTAVELATWQLRRIYELVSRREDLGVDVDSGTRLEMELRLGEAAFLLTSLKRFERPEKFRQFQRMGRNSPFREREIEPEDTLPSRATKSASSESESNSPTSPDYSASTS
jgi:hypothetical protein